MATYIEGTNIPVSAIAGNIKGDAAYWADRLRGAENPNDVLFSMAYSTPFAGQTLLPGQDVWQGQGQGNPNVGALQSNIWSLTGDQPSWAEQAVQNPGGQSDIYQDRSDPNNVTAVAGIDYGQSASADDMARAGTNLAGQSHFFYGTNMPTTGFTATQINDFNNRLRTEIDSQNWKGANDAMFDIAWNMGKNFYGSPTDDQGGYGQGNKFIGMLQSDMFSLTDPAANIWGEDYINSENDVYTLRDLSGNPRGEAIRYDDTSGSYIDTGGPPNPTVPSFGYSGYKDWTRFMPTNFQLAEGGGRHYQPWVTGGAGMGGGAGGFAGPDTWATAGPDGTVRNTSIYTGGIGTNPNIWGGDGTSNVNTTTDASGNKWVMTPQGNWIPADSDYATALANNTALDYNFYNPNTGEYGGSEGRTWSGDYNAGGQKLDQYGDVLDTGTAWQNVPFLGDLIRTSGWNINPVYAGQQTPLAPGFIQTTAPGYDYTMDDSAATEIDITGPEGGYGQDGGGRDYGGGYHGR